MTLNRDDAYVKTLSRSLDRVLDLQKFAEAKNASLLAFLSAWIAGLVNLLSSDRHLALAFREAGTVALALFVIAAVTAITSFLPRFVSSAAEGLDGETNMLFFGDIAREPVAAFTAEARRRYYPVDERIVTDTLFIDLSRQIAIVSKISMRKYRTFNVAATAALLGIAAFMVPVVGMIVDLVR